MEVEKFKLFASKVTKNVNKVIVGKEKNSTKIHELKL